MDRFQVLCLSGGGFRGLYTASVLAHLEDHFGKQIHECFDLICGTSIGGVIATGLGFNVSAKDIQTTLLQDGPKIFQKQGKGIFKAPYNSVLLRRSIEKLLPEEKAKIGDACTPYLTTAVNVHTGLPRVFKTPHLDLYVVDKKLAAVDAALATSAAPLFFPPARVEHDDFVDGGLFANAPDLIGLHEAEYFLKVPSEKVNVLSIGTTGKLAGLGHKNKNSWGAWDWIKGDKLIVELTFSAQQNFAENIIKHKLGDRYFKIDETHSGHDSFAAGLADTSEATIRNLESLSNKSFMNAVNKEKLKTFFSHIPNRTKLKYNFLELSEAA